MPVNYAIELQGMIQVALGGVVGLNVYAQTYADNIEPMDPDVFPAVVVVMPWETATESLCETLQETDYTGEMFLFNSNDDAREGDVEAADWVSTMRRAIAGASLRIAGFGVERNNVKLSAPEPYVLRGQDNCFKITWEAKAVVSV